MTGQVWTEESIRALVRRQFADLLPDVEVEGADNFFRHGGDSIGMLRLVQAVHDQGLPLTARDFVTRPTPDGVVQSVLARLAQSTADADG